MPKALEGQREEGFTLVEQAPTAGSVAYAASGAMVTLATRNATGSCFHVRDTATGWR